MQNSPNLPNIAITFAFSIAIAWMPAFLPNATGQDLQLTNIPFVQKKPDFGGEACVEMALKGLGSQYDQDAVFDRAGVNPELGRGCVAAELIKGAKGLGLRPGIGWYTANDQKSLDRIWTQCVDDLNKKRPSIFVARIDSAERFVIVIGFNQDTKMVTYHDPNQKKGQRQTASLDAFQQACLLKQPTQANPKNLQVVKLRVVGRPIKFEKQKEQYTDADYAQHIRKLKTKLPNQEFKIVLQKPFVVVGDTGTRQLKRTAEGTVKWAVNGIKNRYFDRDPYHIIDVWLFKNETSYEKHNVELFGEKPTTPYGYYSPTHRALVMNISTGGGTLVHEIVHPFMESNFEACPSWFNEGLASLYEQSSNRSGKIVGLTNWRLRGLQQTIDAKRLPSFEDLCGTSTREFYQGAGTNYAQARYLCYYLQEKGLLEKYYRLFKASAEKDPGGYKTLKKILDVNDMKKFQQKWERYVMKLRFG